MILDVNSRNLLYFFDNCLKNCNFAVVFLMLPNVVMQIVCFRTLGQLDYSSYIDRYVVRTCIYVGIAAGML